MQVVIHLILPLTLTMILLFVRNTSSGLRFTITSIIFLIFAIIIWWLFPNIYYYNEGPKMSAYFESWTVPLAVFSIAIVCAVRAEKFRFRIMQFIASFIAANFWLSYTGWLT
jgi:hypothetical protein